LYHLIWVC